MKLYKTNFYNDDGLLIKEEYEEDGLHISYVYDEHKRLIEIEKRSDTRNLYNKETMKYFEDTNIISYLSSIIINSPVRSMHGSTNDTPIEDYTIEEVEGRLFAKVLDKLTDKEIGFTIEQYALIDDGRCLLSGEELDKAIEKGRVIFYKLDDRGNAVFHALCSKDYKTTKSFDLATKHEIMYDENNKVLQIIMHDTIVVINKYDNNGRLIYTSYSGQYNNQKREYTYLDNGVYSEKFYRDGNIAYIDTKKIVRKGNIERIYTLEN